jgi:uncharacterized protein
MVTKEQIEDFIAQKKLAVVGFSSNPKKFGNMIYKSLIEKGYKVYPINPKGGMINAVQCYANIASLPEQVDGVIIVIKPLETEKVVQQALSEGIKRVWIQQGAESKEAIKYCEDNGISVVYKECIMMYTTPKAFPHSIHRFFRGIFGKMPK